MPIPTKNQVHRPILEFVASKGETPSTRREIVRAVAEKFSLTPDEIDERSPSGSNRVYTRSSWSLMGLRWANLVEYPRRGQIKITRQGEEFIKKHEGRTINDAAINKWKQGQEQLKSVGDDDNSTDTLVPVDATSAPNADIGESAAAPDEIIYDAYQQLQDKLADDMLDALKGVDPYQFERIVLALLEKMGYGTGQQVGRSGDGGIDGVINQDPLGLEKVYIQAKRWQNTVGEPEIRNFSGSLATNGAAKGVFITTSNFSTTARQAAQTISAGIQLIRLINGHELARLMIQHGVGVVTEITYEVKKLDENYFSDSDDI